MKFLMITYDPASNVGGLENRAKAYSKSLSKLGHGIIVISMIAGQNFKTGNDSRSNFVSLPSSLAKVALSLVQCLRIVRRSRVDSLFILSGAHTLLGILLLAYAKFQGIASGVLLHGRDVLTSRKNPILYVMMSLALALSQRVAANSRFTSSLVPRLYRRKLNIIYPGVDPAATSQATKTLHYDDAKRILFVGRLVKRKGADDLLSAFKDLLSDFPQAILEVVGDGPERNNLQHLAAALGLDNKVRFYGALTGKPLYDKYRQADVFVMPSKKINGDVEGFGSVFLEAGLFGKPSIGTWSGGIPEAVVHGETGILVTEGDISQLRQWMYKLLTDRKEAERLGKNARARVLQNFTWENSTEALLRLFEDN